MSDYMTKVLAFHGQVKAVALVATESISTAQKKHDTWSAATAALGRTLIGTTLLASSLKDQERISVQIHGNGLGGKIFTDANGQGDMRGYISNPHVSLPLNEQGKLDVRTVVGDRGTMTVIKDLGMREPFSGQIPIVDGELGADFTYYMAVSEQINGSMGLSVLVNPDESVRAAGGFMIQLMPGATEETIVEIEKRLSDIPMISSLLDQEASPEDLLDRLLGKENIQPLETMPVQFKCSCTRDKFSSGLIAIGEEELKRLVDEDHGAEVVCHFCSEKFFYSNEDLLDLIEEIRQQKLQA